MRHDDNTAVLPDQVIQCWRVVFAGRVLERDFPTREAAEAELRTLTERRGAE